MKKTISAIIIIILAISCLTACSGGEAGKVEKELLGTWYYSKRDGAYGFTVDYQFSKNGEGAIFGSFTGMGVSNSELTCTYTIDTDKQCIFITNDDSDGGDPVKLTYQWVNEELILKLDGVKLTKR